MTIKFGVLAAATAGSLLAGCVSLPPNRGAGDVQRLVESRSAIAGSAALGAPPGGEPQLAGLLASPLDADAAVRVALIGSPQMRVLYAELGLAQADVYDATRLSNPSLGYEGLAFSGGGAQSTWSLSQGFMEVLFTRYRNRLGRFALLETEQRVAHSVLQLESRVRTAWLNHAAAQQVARLRSGAARAAQVSAELAQRFHEAGNISELQLAREQSVVSSALVSLRKQESEVAAARSALLALIGVEDRPEITLVDRMSQPVLLQSDLTSLQGLALKQRLDLQALRTNVDLSESQQAFAARWRWLNGLAVELSHEREADGGTLKGGGISLELPIFNSGRGKALRATAMREMASAVLHSSELHAIADVASSLAALKAAEQNAAEYRNWLLPLQQRIVELTQQRQNFMLVGAFEVIEVRRQEIEAWQGYVESLRDYAIARTELARALGGNVPGVAANEDATIPEMPVAEQTGEAQ
jgi:outer membrane protein, heavy metal efflux system